ncbi:MAG: Flp family type IVb pilin [Chloroflexota bacterium]
MIYLVSAQLKLQEFIHRLTHPEDGQDMIEYALLAALISIFAIAAIVLVGPKISNLFSQVTSAFNDA